MGKKKIVEPKITRKYKFADSEIWNADYSIINYSYQIIKKYKKSKRLGYPAEVENPEEWEKILDRILKSFKRILNDYNDSPINKALDKLYKKHPKVLTDKWIKQKDGTYVQRKDYQKLYDKYLTDEIIAAEKAYNQEIEAALKLFGTYLRNLWY